MGSPNVPRLGRRFITGGFYWLGPISADSGQVTQDTASSGNLLGTDLTAVYTLYLEVN